MRANSVTICLIVKGATLDVKKGEDFVKLATSVMRILSVDGVENNNTILLPLINEAHAFRNSKALENKLTRPIDLLQGKLTSMQNGDLDSEEANVFTGVEFPQQEEIETMIKLLRSLVQNYRCISPIDNPKHLKKFEKESKSMKIEEVK